MTTTCKEISVTSNFQVTVGYVATVSKVRLTCNLGLILCAAKTRLQSTLKGAVVFKACSCVQGAWPEVVGSSRGALVSQLQTNKWSLQYSVIRRRRYILAKKCPFPGRKIFTSLDLRPFLKNNHIERLAGFVVLPVGLGDFSPHRNQSSRTLPSAAGVFFFSLARTANPRDWTSLVS